MAGGGTARVETISRRELASLSRQWNVDLRDVVVRISGRLRTSIGRADLERATISIAPRALTQRGLLLEVLRHEAAHIAAARLGATAEGPHGPTWAGLLLSIGSEPRVKLVQRARLPRRTARAFRHECTVCDFVRTAKRRVSAWRCAECVAAGLPGLLLITEVTK